MVEVLNLRIARKRKERARRERLADENRARFGRAKADATCDEALRTLENTRHEAHRLDDGDDG